jgi:hypothetical protein
MDRQQAPDALRPADGEDVRCHDEATVGLAAKLGHSAFYFRGIVNWQGYRAHRKLRRRGLERRSRADTCGVSAC